MLHEAMLYVIGCALLAAGVALARAIRGPP